MRGYFVVCKFCKRLACRSTPEEKTSTSWWFDGFPSSTENWANHMKNHHKSEQSPEDEQFNVCKFEDYI